MNPSKLVIMLALALTVAVGCGGGSSTEQVVQDNTPPVFNVDDSGNSSFDTSQLELQLLLLPLGELTDAETAGLLLMREEEKLAGDVYLALYNLHGQRIFDNIAQSEQTHTAAVKLLLDRYDLSDPVGANGMGVFTDPDLQDLHDSLVAAGTPSLLLALQVGAQVEELDIYDIARLTAELEDNQDIALVYDNLAKGSRNHLRSFYRQILDNGGSYTPQYITQEEFDAIVNSAIESG